MKVLIVEDETAAYESLVEMLKDAHPLIDVVANTESVRQTIQWLRTHPEPDLIFMDIHLSDGSSFLIFEHLSVETPIVFTTAYDDYAIEAFKLNSVDYLLKPIKAEELARALHKFSKWTRTDALQYLTRLAQLAPPKQYKDKLLLPQHDQLLLIDLHDVSYFYTTDKSTLVCLKNGQTYPYAKTLEQVLMTLDPLLFYRANKQYLIARDAVKSITIWFDSRLLVTLRTNVPERLYVSKNKAAEFKAWLVND